MSIVQSIFDDQYSGTAADTVQQWLVNFFGGNKSAAGVRINAKKALGLSAYYACIRCISEDIGKLPLITYERLEPRGKRRAKDHPTFALLHDSPNEEMTAIAFRETLTHHALGWGGGFAEIARNGKGEVAAFWPIHPSRVILRRNKQGKLHYEIRSADVIGQSVFLRPDQVLHIHGLGIDGLSGYGMSVLGRESIGLGIEAEQFGARFFANDATPGTIIRHPNTLSQPALKNLRESWAKRFKGAGKSHKAIILEEGMDIARIGVPPEEAQFLETREFQVVEICRWFRIPPHKIQHLKQATFSNIESQNIEYVVDTLTPWSVRWEQELKRKIFFDTPEYFAEHLFSGLLRGDQAQRSTYYRNMFYIGAKSPNDILECENENPYEGGDAHYVPANMARINADGTAESLQQSGKQQADDTATARETMLPVLEAAIAPVFAKQEKAVERALKKQLDPKSFDAWLRPFLEQQRQYYIDSVTPAADALARLIKAGADASAAVLDAGDDYIRDAEMTIAEQYNHGKIFIDVAFAYAERLADKIEMEV